MAAPLYPVGYGKRLVTMSQLRAEHENHMEPEFARRLFNWLEARGGHIGIGGGRRTVQPTKPGFAPPGRSFHQDQEFCDGTVWYSAVDLVARNGDDVHRAPRWDEVPRQGGVEAARWGVHCNVDQGATPEPWHMQAVPQDGFDTWVKAGRPRPDPSFVIPGAPTPDPTPPQPPDEEDDDMTIATVWSPDNVGHEFVVEAGVLRHRAFKFAEGDDPGGYEPWETPPGATASYVGSPSASMQPDQKLAVITIDSTGQIWKQLFEWNFGWHPPVVTGQVPV